MTSKPTLELDGSSSVVLDKLEELSIKNLDCEQMDDSPSYGTASLPTPEAPCADFSLPLTARASPYPHPLRLYYTEEDLEREGEKGGVDEVEKGMVCPGAPLLRDLDSFTDGTGCGSFADLPLAATNEVGELIHAATEDTVSQLPCPEPPAVWIERWREDVAEGSSIPVKRRRSPSPEDDRIANARRIRPRLRAMSLPSSFKVYTQYIGYPSTRSEPEAPD